MKKLFLVVTCLAGLTQLVQADIPFPQQLNGIWNGYMYISSYGNYTDTVLVTLSVAETDEPDTWIWHTAYASADFSLEKNYLLKLIDQDKQLYLMDEQNGIGLQAYLYGDILYTIFSLKGQIFHSRYELIDDQLIFEVISGGQTGQDTVNTSENNPDQAGANSSVIVDIFSVANVQRVVLKRKNKKYE
ncbi:MAG: hypothetical protein ACNS62_04685 [Candidatus Cyclobacteriaceae bacterium M3_2C_046]